MFWLFDYIRTMGDNFGVVKPEAIFRSAALDESDLYSFAIRHNLKSVVDLREKDRARKERKAWLFNFPLNDRGPVDEKQLSQILAFIHDVENQPLLIHCQGGRHRTGTVAFLYETKYLHHTIKEAQVNLFRHGFYRHNHDAWADFLKSKGVKV